MMGFAALYPSYYQHRHCEEQGDEAIQNVTADCSLDCFASLAMTEERGRSGLLLSVIVFATTNGAAIARSAIAVSLVRTIRTSR